MTTTQSQSLTLEQFLQLPETKPASEYIDGKIIQKPKEPSEFLPVPKQWTELRLTVEDLFSHLKKKP